MDIKDFILIGGGLLIAAVVAHGFWIAWRDRRQDLRIDIKPDLIPDDIDEMDRLRGELPNGGGRVVKPHGDDQVGDVDAGPDGGKTDEMRHNEGNGLDQEVTLGGLRRGRRWGRQHVAGNLFPRKGWPRPPRRSRANREFEP